MTSFNMGQTPPVTFGPGRVAKVPRMAATLSQGPILIVADAALVELGLTDRLTGPLSEAGATFNLAAVVVGEPKLALIDELTARARALEAKLVIGIGGGAAMDAAKVVAAIARSNDPAEAYSLAAKPLPKDGLPAIAIPTTAGTGSEVTRTSVISEADGAKTWFWGEDLMFAQAVLDPELTLSLPPHLTAWTGVDAVAHALEGSTSRNTSPAGQLYGLQALTILTEYLPRAVADGSDLDARSKVLWASLLAGLALHNCNTHMGHNISHAMGSLVRVHHGLATGLALEATLPWLVARPEGVANYAQAALVMGGSPQAEALPDALSNLMRKCKIAKELPAECEPVSPQSLVTEMKSPANIGMARNSACPVSDRDMEEMATLMLSLPCAAVA